MVESRSGTRNRKQQHRQQRSARNQSSVPLSSSTDAALTAESGAPSHLQHAASAMSSTSSAIRSSSFYSGSDTASSAQQATTLNRKSKKQVTNSMNSESSDTQLTSKASSSAAQQDQIAVANDNQSNGHSTTKPELFRFSPLYILRQAALVSEANEEELCTRNPSGKQLHHQEHPQQLVQDQTEDNKDQWSVKDVQAFVQKVQDGESLLHCSLRDNCMFRTKRGSSRKSINQRTSPRKRNFLSFVYYYLVSKELLSLKLKIQRTLHYEKQFNECTSEEEIDEVSQENREKLIKFEKQIKWSHHRL